MKVNHGEPRRSGVGPISITQLFEELLKAYGPQNWWPAETPFEVCLGAVLTQNTAWDNAHRAVKNLIEAGIDRPEKLLNLKEEELQALIKPAGFYKQKAKYLKELSRFFVESGGLEKLKELPLERVRSELLKVKGVGPETADAILLYALQKATFVADKYAKRLFYRLGITQKEELPYDTIKEVVESEVKPSEEAVYFYNELHALIVEHCKRFCKAKPDCSKCPLKELCYNPQKV